MIVMVKEEIKKGGIEEHQGIVMVNLLIHRLIIRLWNTKNSQTCLFAHVNNY